MRASKRRTKLRPRGQAAARSVCRRVEAIDSLDLLTRLAERLLSAHSLEELGLA